MVGSNTANILLIVGACAMIFPITHWDKGVKRDTYVMIGAAVLLLGLVQFEAIGRIAGLLMVAGLIAYIVYAYVQGKGAIEELADEDVKHETLGTGFMTLLIVGGLATLFVGAELLVRGATNLARDFGVSEAVIGLTVVAVGTSLPELATGIMSALRKHSDIMIGNIVGSNIFNILFILGVTSVIQPIVGRSAIRQFRRPSHAGRHHRLRLPASRPSRGPQADGRRDARRLCRLHGRAGSGLTYQQTTDHRHGPPAENAVRPLLLWLMRV
ncbi:MAG: sodium:calcium antiporter [Rhizobium sp.]|nr:sodium:calcium antiporter [Rhizobium sp.]